MSNIKSPVSDGFSVKFYKMFWNDFNDILLKSYQFSYDAGVLTDTLRKGPIILICKRNKDPLLPFTIELLSYNLIE